MCWLSAAQNDLCFLLLTKKIAVALILDFDAPNDLAICICVNKDCKKVLFSPRICCYTGEQGSLASWDHVFSSLNQYFTTLRQEVGNTDFEPSHLTVSPMMRDISEQELTGLLAVCKLITQVADQVSACDKSVK